MKSYLKFLLLLSFSPQLFASSGWNEKDLSEIYKYADESGFNGAILVSHQEKLIVEEYLGYADSEKITELTRQHRFSPGSVGKEFTTVGIMMREDQGLLSYKDKVTNILT